MAFTFSGCKKEGKTPTPAENQNPAERTEPIDPISSTDHEPLEIEGEPEETHRESAGGDQGTPEGEEKKSSSEEASGSVAQKPQTPENQTMPKNPTKSEEKPATQEKPVHTHSYGAWKEVKGATCTAQGQETRYCSCGKTETRSTKRLGHSFGEWKMVKRPTTTEYGSKERSCKRCGYGETESIEKFITISSAQIKEMLSCINKARAEAGVTEISYASDLQELADIRAAEITEKFSHTRPDGSSCFTILSNVGYWTAGENIAYGNATPTATFNQLWNSEGHRENMMNADFKECIFGYTKGLDGYPYWVQLFISR